MCPPNLVLLKILFVLSRKKYPIMSSLLFCGDYVKQDVFISSWPALTQPLQMINLLTSVNSFRVHISIKSSDHTDMSIYVNIENICF